jgi:predicted ABC-type sugar transport system permease subunit
VAEVAGTLGYQNAQVDRADRYGTRQERAMFAIALVAIAAVLLGLADLFGGGRSGTIALVVAAGALVVAVGWGGSALLV